MDEHYAYLVTQIFKKNDDANLWSQSRWATMLKKTYEDENKIEIKADRNYRADPGLIEEVELDTERLHLFDAENGQRVR